MEAAKELEMMKDGARRMQEFLQNNGVAVKHSMMLEAISAGFGSRNWRTVRDKLNAPANRVVTLEDLGGLRWAVHAIYCDNNQRYMDYYKGETALEAQIIAQVERFFSEEGSLEIEVSCVVDRLTGEGADEESFASEASIVDVSKMLQRLAVAARRNLSEPPQRGVAEADAWDSDNLSIEVFEELLGVENGKLTFDQEFLTKELNQLWYEDQPDGKTCIQFFSYTDLRGEEWSEVSPTGELDAMVNIALRGGIEKLTDDEKICVYQARAIIEYGHDRFNYLFASFVTEP